MSDENKFWIAAWSIVLLGFAVATVAADREATRVAALCKDAIEKKADFAIARMCR